jgi:hypothetical protein
MQFKSSRRPALLELRLLVQDQMVMRNSSLGTPVQSRHVMQKHRHDDILFQQTTTDTELATAQSNYLQPQHTDCCSLNSNAGDEILRTRLDRPW